MQTSVAEPRISEENLPLEEVQIGSDMFLKITDVDHMRPFFMSVVSDSNHWLFLSSNGGVSAGRKNADFALFPYYTDDKITESAEHTGCKSIFRVERNGEIVVWEPFSIRNPEPVRRHLYKSRFGNKVIFEEIHPGLDLAFRYEWNTSNQFGFVRKASLLNRGHQACSLQLLDGFQNLVPYGVGADLQNSVSNLADAYKRSELVPESGLGIFALSAIIVDKAEPSEALKANTVWSLGLPSPTYLLSTRQIDAFRRGEDLVQEEDCKGEKGAYLVRSEMSLEAGSEKTWMMVANVNQTQSDVIRLSDQILTKPIGAVLADVEIGTQNLVGLAAAADGLQVTADDRSCIRHFSNVLFNIMRGGIFDENYRIDKGDFRTYLRRANRDVFARLDAAMEELPATFSLLELRAFAARTGSAHFQRLATEYLPLKFSRRHGDPSRPWNKFTINTRSEVDGSKILDYEGNWRDIFQNWEALAHAYPEFIDGMVTKFLNASTFDGYNPYRVTKGGFDWETIEPDNPWSYIGYWGDHQIIYLLKLLEIARDRKPATFPDGLARGGFVYAHVPYRIKPYSAIVENPKDTIEFDHKADRQIRERMAILGADGALLRRTDGEIHQVTFVEKILATVLSKLSNLVPEGGIWMNTQRPEWNDANNALVGNGLSMVTVCYLRRFLDFFIPAWEGNAEYPVSVELAAFLDAIHQALKAHPVPESTSPLSDVTRKHLTDALGEAGSAYRERVYQHGFSGDTIAVAAEKIRDLFSRAQTWLEQAISRNKRPDHLYHTYNLITVSESAMHLGRLSEMLEGQVAVLSSGFLSAQESLAVLDALRESALYRPDQNSYLLYPNKELPRFLKKNTLKPESAEKSELLQQLLRDGNTAIVEADVRGNLHFNGNFRNAQDLLQGLKKLDNRYSTLVARETALVLDLFEAVFQHKEFTGRSGTFFGYEGLGSIYWHMVSKLLLAVQETCLQAIEAGTDRTTLNRLLQHYDQIQAGIGVHKSPALYGAFPTDPYSHTPQGKGAQQPGMTGQVKEDILCRLGELGLRVRAGQLHFSPNLLHRNQLLPQTRVVEFRDVDNQVQTLELEANTLFFTYCQVPVVYQAGDQTGLSLQRKAGHWEHFPSPALSEADSRAVFQRTGEIRQIRVQFPHDQFRN